MVGGDTTAQHWELDEKILQRSPDEVIKKENLLKTSAEMFSIYLYCKDPMMRMRSDKYTNYEYKAVKDLVSIEESLLVSSQMANSLLLLQQHEKLIKDAEQEIKRQSSKDTEEAPAASASESADSTGRRASEDVTKNTEKEEATAEASVEPSAQAAPSAVEDDENEVLADLNN